MLFVEDDDTNNEDETDTDDDESNNCYVRAGVWLVCHRGHFIVNHSGWAKVY